MEYERLIYLLITVVSLGGLKPLQMYDKLWEGAHHWSRVAHH